eukprot:CAMPEP_0198346238 /NCGR_PEP_ID=MMETSP1450-20131203/78461_1 /TAXON_ID=753684 ORGANISM="Madagascaria erythrocladiodes, Strain CCMP3234" /NCGR_SAMPLE_ID=MMETSP1450 /ASSEMBLY_ACC=CAM_ASM_001115 /LENGTH=78 /DNA_ID=CAMNT_0044051647 /DNA_START=57 /DNA_END=290 /DNA_ORIENTATION=-
MAARAAGGAGLTISPSLSLSLSPAAAIVDDGVPGTRAARELRFDAERRLLADVRILAAGRDGCTSSSRVDDSCRIGTP